MPSRRRICVVGLDGANEYIIDIMNLKHLGTFATLISTLPPYTPPAWTSILTGVNPGKHGIFGFIAFDDGEPKSVTAFDVKYPRLFEILAFHKLRSVVINTPLTYPPSALVGLKRLTLVSDWASPKQAIWPSELHVRYKEYLVDPPHAWYKYEDPKEYVKAVEEYLRKRLELYSDLMETLEWDFFFTIFSEIDWVLHKIPSVLRGNSNLIGNILYLIKRFVKRAIMHSDFLLIVSDHGFEEKYIELNINSVLRKYGLLKYRYLMSSKNLRFLNPLLTVVPESFLRHLMLTSVGRRLFSEEITYSRSLAFIAEPAAQGVYLKDEGYCNVLKKLISSLPGILSVHTREEVYWGPHVRKFPKLIVSLKPHVKLGLSAAFPPVVRTYAGDHNAKGIFLLIGESVEKGTHLKPLRVYDITPTILGLFNLPLPFDSDGLPLGVGGVLRKENYLLRFKLARAKARFMR